jgi:ribosomal protein L37AE/L43A
VVADPTIHGHPAVVFEHEAAPPTLLTVCAECGQLRTILFLARDRWFCTRCRAEGAAPPNLYPVA